MLKRRASPPLFLSNLPPYPRITAATARLHAPQHLSDSPPSPEFIFSEPSAEMRPKAESNLRVPRRNPRAGRRRMFADAEESDDESDTSTSSNDG
ncbi:hypothetical protein BD410DRAFT_794805 [Rickenella mellea]|uniref:Uncharacterized protein n=1 Tax=Rickenella mellea TaxID=50990 RepID=A0A4Y7PQV9_9AGAM|nr:hypothetical protein BD410DRAFT_794805 [Rickenella mellea]